MSQTFTNLSTTRYYRIAVSTFYFIQGLVFASWAGRIPDIQKQLGLSEGALGAILFAMPVGQLTATMVSGHIVNRLGSKRALLIGALLYPPSLLLLGLATSVMQLLGGLFLFGVFGNLSNISINTQAVGVERLYRRSIMASFHGLWSLAGFAGGIISAVMVSLDFSPFLHFCLVYAGCFILLLLAKKSVVPRDFKPESVSKKRKKFARPDSYIVTLGLIAFACMICEGTMFDWTGIYFEQVVEAPKSLTRMGYIAFMCTMAAGRFVSDGFVTRFGSKKILQVSGIIIVAGMLLSVAWPQIVPATIGFLLVGIGTSSVVPLAYSLAGRSRNMAPGSAMAMVTSIGFLGFLLGPPFIGFIAEYANLRVSFALVALLGLGTTLLARRLDRMNR
jgi:MFS family permease